MKGKITMFCPNCGFQNADGARFCNECGAPLTAPAAPAEPFAEEVNEVPAETPEIPVSPEIPEAVQEEAPVGEPPFVPEEAPVEEPPFVPEEPPVEEPPFVPEEPPAFVPPVPEGQLDRRPEMNEAAGAYVPPFVPTPPVGPDRANVPPMQPPFMAPPESSAIHPVIAAMKKVFSSPLFIIAVFASLASVILSFIASITTNVTYNVTVGDTVYKASFGGTDIGSAIPSLIAGLLTPLALLLILIPAMNKKDSKFSTAGFTFLKVLAIIGLVGVCIAGAAVIAGFVLLTVLRNGIVSDYLSKLGDAGYVDAMKKAFGELNGVGLAAVIIAMVIIAAVLVFAIIYLAKYIKTLNTYKKVAAKSTPSDRVSPFFAVVTIICGVILVPFAVVSAIYGLYLHAASVLLDAVYMICFGLVVFKFRDAMRALKESAPAQPVPPQGFAPQGYAPVPPQGYAQPQGYVPPQQNYAPQFAPIVCPRCGGKFSPELTFCPHCGLPR